MKWETVRLGDIIDFSNGINFDKSAYTQGIKIVGVSDFGNLFSPNYDELSEVKSDIVKSKDLLKNGDIVFVRSNGNKELVGRCMLVKKLPYPVTYSGFCIRARINSPNSYNSVFLTYYFKSMFFRKLLSGSSVGANIQNLSQARLSNCTISIPHIQTQKRIAGILSAYDDLIENNQKQIKLLEEAAQRLYKEWFVDLRFPDHEHTAVVDGVPEGWRKQTVGSVIKKIDRTKQIKTSDYLSAGKVPVIDQSKKYIAGYTNDEESIVDIDKPVIVFGDHTRILKYITFPFAKGADGTQLIVSNDACIPQSLLYCSLLHIDLSNYHYARHFKYLKAEEIILPTKNTASRFMFIADYIFNRIQCLRNTIAKSQQARDRLLPKLMSGEMEV